MLPDLAEYLTAHFFLPSLFIRHYSSWGRQNRNPLLGIFYKRMNKEGAIAGMVVGIVSMIFYMVKYKLGWLDDTIPDKSEWWFGISPEGFGTIAMLLNFIVSISIMKLTPQPPADVQEIVENIRIPSGAAAAIDH